VGVKSLLGDLVLKSDLSSFSNEHHWVNDVPVRIGNSFGRDVEDDPFVVGISVRVKGDLLLWRERKAEQGKRYEKRGQFGDRAARRGERKAEGELNERRDPVG